MCCSHTMLEGVLVSLVTMFIFSHDRNFGISHFYLSYCAALNAGRSSEKKAAHLSVCPSVCQTHGL